MLELARIKMRAGNSSKTKQELLNRNMQLAGEIVRLQNENRHLKKKVSGLMLQRLGTVKPLCADKVCQTDPEGAVETTYSCLEKDEVLFLTPKLSRRISPRSETISSFEKSMTASFRRDSDASVISPIQERVSQVLNERIIFRQADTPIPVIRPPRSIKKPVTYKEPSLRVKVRKGYNFFKFE